MKDLPTNQPTALGFSGRSVNTGDKVTSVLNLVRQQPQLGSFSSSFTFIQKSTLYLFHKNWYHYRETFHLRKETSSNEELPHEKVPSSKPVCTPLFKELP